jgi:hypothetical protein
MIMPAPTPAAPSTQAPPAPAVTAPTAVPFVEPTTQAELTPAQASKMAQWAREDLLAGKITQAQADKQFAELNTPLDQRGPDTRSDEEKLLDKQFPPAKPEDYRIQYYTPGQAPPVIPKEVKEFDQHARSWLSGAGFPRDVGNSLVNAIARTAQLTKDMTPDQLQRYAFAEFAKLERAHGAALEERLQAAGRMVEALERKQPGLKQLLKSKGIGDSAMVANLLMGHAQIYHARVGAKGR